MSGSAGSGRDWADDLPIHEFLDATKFSCADRRHRVVLHHTDLGGAIAARAFPGRTDVEALVSQHVREDLGQEATLSDWFEHCEIERLPKPIYRRIERGPAGIADQIAARLGEADRVALDEVCAFLFEPLTYDERALPVLMNCAGPMIVRRVFGPPAHGPSGAMVDYGLIAEAAIFTAFGRIPDLAEIVRCWTAEPVASGRSETR